MRVNRTTATYSIVNVDYLGKPCGGPHNVKFDDEMQLKVQEFLEDNVHLTIRVLKATLRLELPNKPNVHDKTVSNATEGLPFN